VNINHFRVNKFKIMRFGQTGSRHVRKNADKIISWKFKWKRSLGRLRLRWENIIQRKQNLSKSFIYQLTHKRFALKEN